MVSFNFALVVAASSVIAVSGFSSPTAYGIGKVGFDDYRATLPNDFNVVAEGGWYSLQQRYLVDVGKEKFQKTKLALPDDFDVVSLGGFDTIHKLAADPKAELVNIIVDNLKGGRGPTEMKDSDQTIDTLVALLSSQGKGFSSVLVDGEWCEVLTRQGKKSSTSQKLAASSEKAARPTSNFDVKTMDFNNVVLTKRGNGVLSASVKYNPIAQNFDKTTDGRIVLRRISCDITGATFKYKKLPKLSLPFLKKTGGFLDFLYLDNDMRITRGNRGGLFVHFKPEFYEKLMD